MSVGQHERLDAVVNDLLSGDFFLSAWRRLEIVPSIYRHRKVVATIQGQIFVDGHPVPIVIGFRDSFPLSLPLLFVTPFDVIGFIPHVDEDGYVCYVHGNGQYINYHDPEAIVKDALFRTSVTLTEGYRGENIDDFTDGFSEYWGRLQGAMTKMSLIVPGSSFQKVIQVTATSGKKGEVDYFAMDEQSIRSLTFSLKKEKFNARTSLYVPLNLVESFKPPRYGEMWSLSDIHGIVDRHTSSATKASIKRETTKWKKYESVVFGLPRPSGGWVLFAISFSGVGVAHPLRPESSVKKITPVALQRLDRDYLMTRGGSNMNLHGKHVAVIGCGSVGGNIAFKLAQSGIGKLTLIDHDMLSPENAFRHTVGYHQIGSTKVSALKIDLELRVPYIDVEALPKRIESLLQADKFSWLDYDLIIVATGEPTVNLYMNEMSHDLESSPPVIFSWLDPYGIGGHSLLQNADQPGCLNCLYEFTDAGQLNNRASFAQPGQSFLKDIAGCGSLFTPFASLDVERTATEAVRLALNALTTGAGNQIVSWKGDATSFLSQGYHLAHRYEQDEKMMTARGNEFKRDDCPICHKA